jgi:hypothetical protein
MFERPESDLRVPGSEPSGQIAQIASDLSDLR